MAELPERVQTGSEQNRFGPRNNIAQPPLVPEPRGHFAGAGRPDKGQMKVIDLEGQVIVLAGLELVALRVLVGVNEGLGESLVDLSDPRIADKGQMEALVGSPQISYG